MKNQKIRRQATRTILGVSLAGLVVSSGPVVQANPIDLPQNVSEKAIYGHGERNDFLAERLLGLEISKDMIPGSLRAPENNESNYAEDEAKIKDFSDSERYRSTQMKQGNGPAFSISAPQMNFLDGFRYNTLEPSATSGDKTLWGLEFEFDKEKGQRTYTDFYFTNTGGFGRPTLLEARKIPANDVGDNLSAKDGFEDPTYKAKAEIDIFASNVNRNLNLYSTKDDLEHINNIDNNKTIMAWKGNYTKDNPNGPKATQGTSSAFGFTVNPWPNENDKLSVIKLNGSHDEKVFVQGQTITTDISVENLDDNARKRLVGQVYHPSTGEIVPGAKAYINDEDKVVIEMPEGAVDENGKINEDSIFYNDPKYKALQNLEVKFFARPRTEEEFRAIGIAANYGEDHYTSTGAGTETINHKGEDVVIDKQGIDRYDHYNLIGSFKLNLDDTRYYDQGFVDGNNDDTSKHTSSKVSPGEEFEVKLYVPEDKKDKDVFPNQKTPEEMEAAKDENQAVGSIDWQFINQINQGKEEKDKWKLKYDESTLPTTFKITPPKSAKAGEFVAVPLTYTYTNGSTDVHWFHFVVQETTNNRPEYFVQVDYPSEEQKSMPKVPEDEKKLSPVSYSIPEGTEFKDDKGNEWTVSIDKNTGEVTAKPNDPSKFDGGEKLQVPVIAHYKDPNEPDKDIKEETKAEFVIKERANMTPRYNAKAGKAGEKLSSEVILNKEDKFNRKPSKYSLASNTFVDSKGNTWNVSIDESTGKVTATVPNAEEGKTIDGALLNVPVTAHYYENDGKEIGTREVEVQFVASGTEGTKTYTEKIPFKYDVKYDPDFYTKYPEATDNFKIVTEGEAGEKTTTWTIKDSQIVGEPKVDVTKKPVDAIIRVGKKDYNGTFTSKETSTIQFKTKYVVDETLAPGEVKVEEEGSLGEEEVTITHTIENGEVVKSERGKPVRTKEPVDRIVKVGTKPTEGTITKTIEREIPFETKIIYDDTMDAGFQEIESEGKPGKEKVTIEQKVKDSKPVGEATETTKTITEKEDRIVRIGVKPVVKVEEIDNNTVYKHNPDLKAGEEKVIEKGAKGSVKYTTTFNKETGKLEVTEERVEPKNKVVEYGTKTDGEFTYESEVAYNVIIRENPNLDAGKHNVLQKGIVGKTETTVKIENSEEVSRDTKTITEKQDMIIEIGTKNICEIPPVDPTDPSNPTNPTDPKDPTDPSNPTDPKDPTDPTNPKDPTDPSSPTDPKDPKDPPKPTDPTDPKDPTKPTDPTDPKNPKDPTKPTDPTDPKDPTKPTDPKKPNGQQTPGQPGTSNTTGEKPTTGNPKANSKTGTSPNTGDDMNQSLYAYVGGMLGAALLALGIRKKRKQ